MEKGKLAALMISSSFSIKETMKTMNTTGEKILFVVNGKRSVMGTVTDGDIRRGLIRGMKFSDRVKRIMCTRFISVSHGESKRLELARELMGNREVEHVPVLDDRKRIVDVVSWTDIFKHSLQPQKARALPNPVVIMAGGKGKRLEPFTKIFPKPLIPIGDKPIVEIIMEKFYLWGLKNFIFTLNFKKEYLKLFLKESKFPYSISWVEESDYLGTAGSLCLLRDRISQPFFVSNCDIVVDTDYAQVLKMHREQGSLMTLVACHKEVELPYGILEIKNGSLKRFQEKPNYDILINTGVYLLEPKVLKFIPRNKPLDMNHLISMVMKKGRVSVYPIYNGWFDLGHWEEYKRNFQELAGL